MSDIATSLIVTCLISEGAGFMPTGPNIDLKAGLMKSHSLISLATNFGVEQVQTLG